jgi:TatA/E family protein of Tat protein translocase
MAYENVLLVVIAMGALFFGAKRLPELAKSLGRAQSEFEKAKIEAQREVAGSYGNIERENDNHTGTILAEGGHNHGASTSEAADPRKSEENADDMTTTSILASSNSSLIVNAGKDDDNSVIDRAKLEEAAKKIGIKNPEKLSDDELRSLIRNSLGL